MLGRFLVAAITGLSDGPDHVRGPARPSEGTTLFSARERSGKGPRKRVGGARERPTEELRQWDIIVPRWVGALRGSAELTPRKCCKGSPKRRRALARAAYGLSDWAAASLRFLLIGLHAGIPPTEYPTLPACQTLSAHFGRLRWRPC